MRGKPDLEAFLNVPERTEVRVNKAQPADPEPIPEHKSSLPKGSAMREYRQAVMVRLPLSIANELKKIALELSIQSGRRVTQQDLLEQAAQEIVQKYRGP